MGIDPALYGGRPAAPVDFGTLNVDPQYAPKASVELDSRPSVPAETAFAPSVPAQAGAAVQAGAGREQAGALASAGAAILSWDSTAVVQAITDVPEKADPNFDKAAWLKNIDIQLTEDEFKLWNKATSDEGAARRLERIKAQRQRAEVAGDNPIVAFAAAIGDPLYWMTGAGSIRAAGMLRGGAAKAVGAGTAAVSGGAISLGAAQVNAKSDEEILAAFMLEGAAGAFVTRGGKLTKADPEFPQEALVQSTENTFKPKVTPAEAAASRSPVEVADEAFQVNASEFEQRLGQKLQININKEFSKFDQSVADTLVDNNSNLAVNSVESHQRIIKAELTSAKWKYDELLRGAMAEDGYGLLHQVTKTADAAAIQNKIEDAVAQEMYRRQELYRRGIPITYDNVQPRIKALADAADAMYKPASNELRSAGVVGAENLQHSPGFFNRRMSADKIEAITDKLIASGKTAEQAHQAVVRMVAGSVRRANDWGDKLAYNVAASMVDRALRKGSFEDMGIGQLTKGELAEMRDMLQTRGLKGNDLQEVLDVLSGKVSERAKAGFLKHRIDMDYSAAMFVEGQMVRVTDLLDNNLGTIMERYIDGASAQAAFARKGLKTQTDIDALRAKLVGAAKGTAAKEEAAKLFNGVVGYMRGDPTGHDIGQLLRNTAAYGRAISLGMSGIWQTTEYATQMAKFGALKSIKHAIAEMPGFKGMMETVAKDKKLSMHLKDILQNSAEQNLRLRPFIKRFEDNYDVPVGASMSMRLQQVGQLVPYVNGMKFIHAHQARMTANLIIDNIKRAADGEAKFADKLKGYGVNDFAMKKLSYDVKKYGFEVDKWSDGTWAAVRPAFSKMMDESVLHQRLGDTPSWALLNPVGKFILTYRSFIITAHNKLFAGGIARDGLAGVSALLLYQFPLAAMAVQAQAAIAGKDPLTPKEMAAKAIGQMGGLGLMGEVWGLANGKAVGAPGLIPFDRFAGFTGTAVKAMTGDQTTAGDVAGKAAALVPLIAVTPALKALQHLDK